MSSDTINAVINSPGTIQTSYDKSTKRWKNQELGTDTIISEHEDRSEAVVSGKNLSKEKNFTHSVLRKNGTSLFKMFHQ